MAYTPINWQTGDTITAEKLNRCDNGWSYESTQLFSETVTTGVEEWGTVGQLTYNGVINMPTITVTFEGTDYECSRNDAFGSFFYGGFGESEPDFTDYPFMLESDPDGTNMLYTATAGTYTISASANVLECGSGFTAAVSSVNEQLGLVPLKLIVNRTTLSQARQALEDDRLVFFKYGRSKMFFVSSVGSGSVTFVPESSDFTAGFDANTGTFYISTSS